MKHQLREQFVWKYFAASFFIQMAEIWFPRTNPKPHFRYILVSNAWKAWNCNFREKDFRS